MTIVGTHSAEPVPRRPVCLDSTRKRRLLNGQGVEPTAHNAPTSLNPTTEETLVPGADGHGEDIHRAMRRSYKSGVRHLARSQYYC
jgi:hypothetical protein